MGLSGCVTTNSTRKSASSKISRNTAEAKSGVPKNQTVIISELGYCPMGRVSERPESEEKRSTKPPVSYSVPPTTQKYLRMESTFSARPGSQLCTPSLTESSVMTELSSGLAKAAYVQNSNEFRSIGSPFVTSCATILYGPLSCPFRMNVVGMERRYVPVYVPLRNASTENEPVIVGLVIWACHQE